MNTHEEAARERKAEALTTQLECLGIDSQVADWMDADGWAAVAHLAGVKVPSLATVDLAVDMLRRREEARRRMAEVSQSFDFAGGTT